VDAGRTAAGRGAAVPAPRARPGERRTTPAALAALLLVGCQGAGPSELCAGANRAGYLGCVEGVSLVLAPGVEAPPVPVLLEQAQRAIELGTEVWGVPRSTWSGWIIEVREAWFPCPTSAGAAWGWGCAYPDRKLIQASPAGDGCALGVLVHELGRAAGWYDHRAPDGTYLFGEADRRASDVCEGPRHEEDGSGGGDDDSDRDDDDRGDDEGED
jgi:hypothetical protein